MNDSLERNLTDQERDEIERERRAALRALFDWLAEMRLPRGVWRQASFYEEAPAWYQQPQQNRKP